MKRSESQSLHLKQMEAQLLPFRALGAVPRPVGGWIRAVTGSGAKSKSRGRTNEGQSAGDSPNREGREHWIGQPPLDRGNRRRHGLSRGLRHRSKERHPHRPFKRKRRPRHPCFFAFHGAGGARRRKTNLAKPADDAFGHLQNSSWGYTAFGR